MSNFLLRLEGFIVKKYDKILKVCYVILAICLTCIAVYWIRTPRTFKQQQKAYLDDITKQLNDDGDEYIHIISVEGSGDVLLTVNKSFLELSNDEMIEKTKNYISIATTKSRKYDKINNGAYARICIQTASEKSIVKTNNKGHIEVVYKGNEKQ